MHNWCICWFSCIFLLGILIFKGLTARHLYKLFGVKGLSDVSCYNSGCVVLNQWRSVLYSCIWHANERREMEHCTATVVRMTGLL
jgi:hypothetical protein